MDDEARDAETLRFNPNNAVTGIVERIRDTVGRTRIRKELRRAGTVVGGPAHWRASDQPHDWNSWTREADVYADTRLRDALGGTGLGLAAAEVRRHADSIELLLEDVHGTPGPDFTIDDHVALATALGSWQARPLDPPPPWASRGFLRAYATSRPAELSLVDDDTAWSQPLIRETWPSDLRDGWNRLLAHREQLFATMEPLPRTLCHLDAWVANAIRRPTGDVVLVDWAFAGDGAIGEDLGNYLPDAVLDLFWPADRLAELEAACWPSYLDALRTTGWKGSPGDARLGVVASSVKYIWLLPLLLTAASEPEHSAYHRPAEAEHLYRQRGIALRHLVDWADEAIDRIR